MGTVPAIVVVAALQQGLIALGWALAAWLRVAPRASWAWAAGNGLLAIGLAMALTRPLDAAWAPWIGWFAANLAVLAGYLAISRGIASFARRPTWPLLHVIVWLGLGVTLAVAIRTDRSWVAAVATGAVVGAVILHTAVRVALDLASECGASAAKLCALPLGLLGALFWVRAAVALHQPQALGEVLYADHRANWVMAFALVVLGLLMNLALAALVMRRLVGRLQHQTNHDALTGVRNRRGLEALIEREAGRHQRFGQGWALLAVDIDHFKQVNDRHGHAAGDAVLVRVARALQACAREVDSVGRVGGEEFVVLLPGADLAGAEQAAHRMLATVRSLQHPELDGHTPVTVSVGVAVASGPGDTAQMLLRRVDRGLYAAKAAGRDRIAVDVDPDAAMPASRSYA
jgi:diguanylate cyclase (GGDEF)-like protein